jgi:TPR repeat protein
LGWRLWHPLGPTRAEALLNDLPHVGPRTVVWLNEAQHYFDSSRETAERVAASLRAVLGNPKTAPILMLGTLWSEYATTYMALPVPARKDPYSQLRELIAGRLLVVPERFDAIALHGAEVLANEGDPQLSHALMHQNNGLITQYLAGAPALLERYKMASPPVRALIQCGMDARRLGADSNLPLNFLARASEDYLTESEYAELDEENWFTESLRLAGESVHGNLAPLTPIRPSKTSPLDEGTTRGSVKLADSLEQLGRVDRVLYCPPQSFWSAACELLESAKTLAKFAEAAIDRYRLCWARRLSDRVVELQADASILAELANAWAESDPVRAEHLYMKSAELGDSSSMGSLGYRCEERGELEEAQEWYRRGAEAGDGFSSCELARIYSESGDLESSERLYRRALELGETESLGGLAHVLIDRDGDVEEVLSLLQRAICTMVRQSARLSMIRLEGDASPHRFGVAPWASRRKSAGWGQQIEVAGDSGDMPRFLKIVTAAASAGDSYGLRCLLYLLKPDDKNAANELIESAARRGDPFAVVELGRRLEEAGNLSRAESLYRESLDAGGAYSTVVLADLMRKVQNYDEAESLYWLAIDSGVLYAAMQLSEMKDEGGDREGAEKVALLAADAGHCAAVHALSKARIRRGENEELWPHGLNPDGTPACEGGF